MHTPKKKRKYLFKTKTPLPTSTWKLPFRTTPFLTETNLLTIIHVTHSEQPGRWAKHSPRHQHDMNWPLLKALYLYLWGTRHAAAGDHGFQKNICQPKSPRNFLTKQKILKSPLSDDFFIFFCFGVTTCCLFQGGLYKFLARQTCEGLITLFPDGDEVFSSLLWGGGFCWSLKFLHLPLEVSNI